jgi:hypothetical protein
MGYRAGSLLSAHFTPPALFHRFPVLSGLLGRKMPLDGARSSRLASRAERFAIGAHPIHRLRAPGAGLFKARQYVAREQFVGALCRLPIRPIMRGHQDAAEAARLGPILLQNSQRVAPAKVRASSPTALELSAETDSALEQRGFEPLVSGSRKSSISTSRSRAGLSA